jgi:hypothetical protein
MNALAETAPVSAQALEHILGTGDLSKLTTQQRVEFYAKTCQSLGLNPLTRPFRFMSFQGNTVMYATRDCTDQLRKVNGITLHVIDKQLDGELFIVTVRARDKHGREDEDMGAVTLGQLKGESRANALMKALTKAKRRVTLSICGLGLTDEAEIDTMPGAATFDAEDETPAAPIRSAAAATPRPQTMRAAVDEDAKWKAFVVKVHAALGSSDSRTDVEDIAARPSVTEAIASGPGWVRKDLSEMLADAYARFATEDADASHEPAEVG